MSDFSIIILLPASPLSVLLIEPTSDIGYSVPIRCSIEILRNVPDMRSREYVVHRSKRMLCWQGFFIEDVDRGSGYCVRLQRLDQRWFINNRPARRVDQAGRWLDQFEFGSSDQVLCAGTQDEVDRNYVRLAEQFVFRNQSPSRRFSNLRSHVLAPRDDLHTEGKANPRDLPADIAKPYDSQTFAAKMLGLVIFASRGSVSNYFRERCRVGLQE